MPFPATEAALHEAGYNYSRSEICAACGLLVEIWTTPGKREIAMEPTPSFESPATQHYKTCQPKEAQSGSRGSTVQDTAGRDSNSGNESPHLDEHARASKDGQEIVPVRGLDARSIKLHGVRDPNYQLLAAGWDDGTLVCQFKTAKWAYAGVPEAEYLKLRNSPYAYRIFNTNIKNKFTATKLEG